MARKNSPTTIVGSIHLYGARHCGHGYISCKRVPGKPDQMFGNGELRAGRSATDALFLGGELLRQKGLFRGMVEVHMDFDGMPKVALADLSNLPYFGQLQWVDGPVVTLKLPEVQP